MINRILMGTTIFLFATPAFAAADLDVDLASPSGVHVYQTGQYDVTVSNIGNRHAHNVTLTIDLPQTNTSPTVHLMGTLDSYDTSCSLSGQTLTCQLGTIRKNKSTSVLFDLNLPYSTAPLAIGASATTTSNETVTSNNSDSDNASLLSYAVPVNAPAAVVNRHCTGQGLTSFFECELYPGSISSHGITLNAGGSISFTNPPTGQTGSWWQPASDQLRFQYFTNGQLDVDFSGVGISADCFEGEAVFPGSSFSAMYEVCL